MFQFTIILEVPAPVKLLTVSIVTTIGAGRVGVSAASAVSRHRKAAASLSTRRMQP